MLMHVARVLDTPTLPRLVVEKLIVLLIRAGVQRGFIDRWAGTLGDRRSAGIRFYLHGAVAQLGPPHRPYHLVPGDSLTSLLKAWGYIHQRDREGYEVAKLPDRPPTTTTAEKEAKAIGTALGLALRGAEPKVRDEELTLIASCSSPTDTAAALAAELFYFTSYWAALARVLFRPDGAPVDKEKVLRRSEIYQAVNNGLWKWDSYLNAAAEHAFQDWRTRISETENAVLAEAFLDSVLPSPEVKVVNPQLDELIETLGHWLIDANIALRQLRITLLRSSRHDATDTEDTSQITELRNQIVHLEEERTRHISMAVPASVQLALPLWIGSEDEESLDQLRANLDHLAAMGNTILDRAEAVVTPFGRPRNYHV